MKTKVTAKLLKDAISRDGRVIKMRIDTDNKEINALIDAPFEFQKTYPINIKLGDLKQQLKSDISGTINSLKQRLDDESLTDLEFEV